MRSVKGSFLARRASTREIGSKSRLLTGWNGTRANPPPRPSSEPATRAPVNAEPLTVVVELIGCADCRVVTLLNCQLFTRYRAAQLWLCVKVGAQTKLTTNRCRVSFAADPFSAAKF